MTRFAWIAATAALALAPSLATAQAAPTADSIVRVGGLSHLFSRSHGRSSRGSDSGSSRSCPCSGRNVCTGPRGGRFCMTSGGNKRYGV